MRLYRRLKTLKIWRFQGCIKSAPLKKVFQCIISRFSKERIKLTVAGFHKFKKTVIINAVISSLKSHPLWVTLYITGYISSLKLERKIKTKCATRLERGTSDVAFTCSCVVCSGVQFLYIFKSSNYYKDATHFVFPIPCLYWVILIKSKILEKLENNFFANILIVIVITRQIFAFKAKIEK